jgi:hypothetical protein
MEADMSAITINPAPTDVNAIPEIVYARIMALLDACTSGELFAAIPGEHHEAALRWFQMDVRPDFAEWRSLQAIERACAKAGIAPKGKRARKRGKAMDGDMMTLPGFCDEAPCPDWQVKKKPAKAVLPVGVVSLDAARARRDARRGPVGGNGGGRRVGRA